jgi:hypothetical protein
MSNEEGTWWGTINVTGDEHRAAGFDRQDGAKAQEECARALTERLGYTVLPGHVRMCWVAEPKPSVGALKGLVGGGDRP